ncbi:MULTISPECIES: hypothetical protein [Sphingobacterium]|uniref:hypothetical protein n=1 Tax=Sphingobacterium TaxID=28453 RepID=UPI001625B90F|nr:MULTISPECIES: hypothetical protein [Sphingobacterium]
MIFSTNSVTGIIFNDFIFKGPSFIIKKLNDIGGNIIDDIYEGKKIKSGYISHSMFVSNGELINELLTASGIQPNNSHFTFVPNNLLDGQNLVSLILLMDPSMSPEFGLFAMKLKENKFDIVVDQENKFVALTDKYIENVGRIQFQAIELPNSWFKFVLHIKPTTSFRNKI